MIFTFFQPNIDDSPMQRVTPLFRPQPSKTSLAFDVSEPSQRQLLSDLACCLRSSRVTKLTTFISEYGKHNEQARNDGRTGERANGRTGERANGRTGERANFDHMTMKVKPSDGYRPQKGVAQQPKASTVLVWSATAAMVVIIIGLAVALQSGGTPGRVTDTMLPSGIGPGQMQLINTPLPTGIGSGQMQLINTPLPSGIGSGQMQLIKQNAPFLGLSLSALPQDVATRLGLNAKQGVYVNSVIPSSPAEKAGIAAGDVLTRLGGTDVTTPDSVGAFLSNRVVAGDVVKAIILHQGSKQSVHITFDKSAGIPQSF